MLESRYKTLAIVGTQWGDEGKGKMTDYFANNWANVVVRSQGGNNAGHTINFDGNKYAVRGVPSGVFNSQVINVIANGCVVNPIQLVEEIDRLKENGFEFNLSISSKAHVICEHHKLADSAIEMTRIDKIGTTGNGIGPCYSDKALRTGIRIGELALGKSYITKKLEDSVSNSCVLVEQPFIDKMADDLIAAYKKLESYIDNTEYLLNKVLTKCNVLFEGAQATMLDIDHGYYPFVTSSNTMACAIPSGCGIAPKYVDNVLGIAKAYSTRVGAGPFVTEIDDDLATYIREHGHEYGTVTGRPRRIGWLDLVVLKYSAMMNGLNGLSIMLLDVLGGLSEVKVCYGYEYEGKIIDMVLPTTTQLANCKPVYKVFEGWGDISQCKTFDELPDGAKKYLAFIESIVGVPINYISVGPDRTQTIETLDGVLSLTNFSNEIEKNR